VAGRVAVILRDAALAHYLLLHEAVLAGSASAELQANRKFDPKAAYSCVAQYGEVIAPSRWFVDFADVTAAAGAAADNAEAAEAAGEGAPGPSSSAGGSGGRMSYAHRRKKRAGKGVMREQRQPAAGARRSARTKKQVTICLSANHLDFEPPQVGDFESATSLCHMRGAYLVPRHVSLDGITSRAERQAYATVLHLDCSLCSSDGRARGCTGKKDVQAVQGNSKFQYIDFVLPRFAAQHVLPAVQTRGLQKQKSGRAWLQVK